MTAAGEWFITAVTKCIKKKKKIKHDFLRSSLNYYSSSAAGAHMSHESRWFSEAHLSIAEMIFMGCVCACVCMSACVHLVCV